MYVNKTHEEALELVKQGKLEEALTILNKLLQLHESNPGLYTDRGTIYLHLNQKEAALIDMDKAISLQPNYAYRYACRAFTKDHFNDTEGAVKDYEKAIELDPTDSVAQNNLGVLLDKLGYKEAAKVRFNDADNLVKNDTSFKQKLNQLENGELKNAPTGIPLEPQKIKTSETKIPSRTTTLVSIFATKNGFSEFIRFIFNGFKIKSNDKS
jgi:tetratricopeptide (TPR) repeat protein